MRSNHGDIVTDDDEHNDKVDDPEDVRNINHKEDDDDR